MPLLPEYLLDVSDYRSILCLNGELPDVNFFQTKLPIIAADGAANTLMKMGIEPAIVIGDLDSIAPEYREQLKTHFHYDQDYCDFEKSISYLQEKGLMPAIILGMNGGFLDHILNNVNIFMCSGSFFYAPPVYGYVLKKNETRKFILPLQTKISIIGMPSAEVTTKGLEWELTQSQLSFPGKNSCFNRNVQPDTQVRVHDGFALVLIAPTA